MKAVKISGGVIAALACLAVALVSFGELASRAAGTHLGAVVGVTLDDDARCPQWEEAGANARIRLLSKHKANYESVRAYITQVCSTGQGGGRTISAIVQSDVVDSGMLDYVVGR